MNSTAVPTASPTAKPSKHPLYREISFIQLTCPQHAEKGKASDAIMKKVYRGSVMLPTFPLKFLISWQRRYGKFRSLELSDSFFSSYGFNNVLISFLGAGHELWWILVESLSWDHCGQGPVVTKNRHTFNAVR